LDARAGVEGAAGAAKRYATRKDLTEWSRQQD
jgi:hypothetical protein